jgi:hypothetical protein
MKLDALDHPKTHDFAARLNVVRPTAIGHLELLWAFTGKNSPRGDIGKWPDGSIARACDWMGPPEVFIQALKDARLVDDDETHRLIIHDWKDHAAGWVKAKLAKAGVSFLGGQISKVPSGGGTSDDSSEDTLVGSRDATREPSTKGSEGKGSEGKRSEGKGSVVSRRSRIPKVPIPDDFDLTPERQVYAETHLPQVDAVALMATFRSTSKAKGWEYVDWEQHWQTLVRQWAPDSGHWSSGQYPRLKGTATPQDRKLTRYEQMQKELNNA